MKKAIIYTTRAVFNSYAILFFSQNRVLGALLVAVSFLNPLAGIAGLFSVLLSLAIVALMKYDRETTRMGIYSFNALLLGIGFGTFYEFNTSFFIWLMVACLVVTMLSVTLLAWLGNFGFPLLSFPFIITFWLVLLAANSLYHMGLEQRNSAILNEMYTVGEGQAYHFLLFNFTIPNYFGLFFRSLSAVLFQNNILSGIVISIGLFIHSRIQFSLLVLAFIAACLFNSLTGTYPEGISYYHLGSNIIMAAGAIGSFFLIPSARSYAWAIVTIPVTSVLINGFTRVFGVYELPVLSLPFAVVTILFIWFFKLRINAGKLQLTPIQHYSPERNLYQFLNNSDRLRGLRYHSLNLPFLGSWTVSQGYDSTITHKAEWGQALDFVIKDEDGRTYQYPGTRRENFYCYNKPVLACADGTVEEIVNHIDDNEIGEVNTVNNWGNCVVIKHATGLYSKVSHLKRNSVKVKAGDFVRQGEVLGMCGSSGRSPEPHLHFQVQATPYIGSKTLAYPFASFIEKTGGVDALRSYQTPKENAVLSPVEVSATIKQAFKLQPGYTAVVTARGFDAEYFEVFTDELNQTYIYSETTGATAYFISNGTSFYFTSFYGDEESLLYYFYLAAYKVVFTANEDIVVDDLYPVQLTTEKAVLWLHDLLAPFHQFIRISFHNQCAVNGSDIRINSLQRKKGFGRSKQTMHTTTYISNGSILGFVVNFDDIKVDAQWV